MRKSLVGAVLAVCALGCEGGSGGNSGRALDEAAFYTAFCKVFVPEAASYPADITQADCEAYYSDLGVASLVPDPAGAASCIDAAPSCEAASENCLPHDIAAECASPTTVKQCRGGTCIIEDCTAWCDFTGEGGGSCIPAYGDLDADCDCDRAF